MEKGIAHCQKYRLHANKKFKLVFNLNYVTKEDELDMNNMILYWFSSYVSDLDDLNLRVSDVEVEDFWQEFFNFFMDEVMHHESIEVNKRMIYVATPHDQEQKENSEIGRMLHVVRNANNMKQALDQFLSRETYARGIQKLCVNDQTGRCIFDANEIAEFANDFLVSVMNDPVNAEQKKWPNTSKRFELSEEMVYDTIMGLKPSTLRSSGMLLLTPEMLQKTAGASAKVLHVLFKMSLDQGKVPSDWRHSLITLKHKDDRLDNIANYRPIGITCAPAKIMEKIVANYLHKVMKKRWNPRQHGNRKHFSTESQLVCLHEELLTRVAEHGRVDCVRLDFTRAADMVTHSLLIEKLRELCVDPVVVRWIEKFLNSRQQSVKVRNAISHPRWVTSGLPQGSPLSNVLLMIYLNDLYKLPLEECPMFQYCDDTIITRNIKCENDCRQLQLVVDKLQDWMYGKKMKVNMTKCFYLTFTLKSKKPDYPKVFPYQMLGENIQRQSSMKYLGVMMSDDFSLDAHYDYLQRKPAIHRLRKKAKALGQYPDLQLSFYNMHVRKKLEKDSSVWNLPFKNDNFSKIIEMESFQNSFLANKSVQRLAERRLFFVLELMFRILSKQKPYMSLMKSLDICEKEFSYADFKKYFQLEESIIGNGLKELVRLRHFVEQQDSNIEFHEFAKQPKSGREKLMNQFCAERFLEFVKVGEEEMEPITAEVALACVSKCLHPNLSKAKLEAKLEGIARLSTLQKSFTVHALFMKLIHQECSED